jgi:conjugative transposon TraN protein
VKRVFLLLIVLIPALLHAQAIHVKERISVSTHKTVSLVFSSHVQTIDRGSEQVLVQKANEHIVKVKAERDSFPESNLTILTADGRLYSFILVFATDPEKLIWSFGDSTQIKADNPLKPLTDKVSKMKSSVPGMKYSSGKVSLQWLGWFVRDNTLFCKIKFTNRSTIGFDIDQFQLYIRDNSISKRTASQEWIQQPLYIAGETGTIKSRSSRLWVIALDKFTLPDDKHFALEVLEKNGGRHLYLKVYNRHLMTAKVF